jgi:hypothetical protein
VVVVAADAGKRSNAFERYEAPRCASTAGFSFWRRRVTDCTVPMRCAVTSTRGPRLPAHDVRISGFPAQTLRRFGAITM